jgi:acyl carrier protein
MPKGVMVEHSGLSNLLYWHCAAFDLKADDRSSCVAGVGFDAASWEIWPPLCVGASLFLAPSTAAHDPVELVRWWECQSVDVSFLPTPIAEIALGRDSCHAPTRTLLTGGDRLRQRPPQSWSLSVVNNYGPTETTVVATSGQIDAENAVVHIGGPISNTQIYILDEYGAPVPIGVAGELYIGGAGVARGYLHRPDLTAERFVADPFAGEPGARMYRTGDLGRWLADGNIEFLGRNDFQVKIRGFRIELGEIEARLAGQAGVREAVVVAREDAPGDKRLVAYYTGVAAVGAEELRSHLATQLPDYMVPAAYVQLERLPLTPNGKLDRKALPAPGGDAYAMRAYEAPRGEVEEQLAAIWCELLKVERVGRHDNFFELGGHSLLAVTLVSRLRQALNVEVPLSALFGRPVLADFAAEIPNASESTLPLITSSVRDGAIPLSFAQQRLWFLAQLEGGSAAYHMAGGLRLQGVLDRGALMRALDRIVARHEALRTTFVALDGEAVQRIAGADIGFALVEHDLRGAGDGKAELGRLAAEEASAPFDLERGPLIRGRLVRLAEDDHALLVTMHHIVSDGWSMGVLTRELSELYAAFVRGEEDPLAPLAVQYADYAVWQRRWLSGEVLQRQAEYWKTTLEGAPALLTLPTDHNRPAQSDYAGASVLVRPKKTRKQKAAMKGGTSS